jgi:hypothetical protein
MFIERTSQTAPIARKTGIAARLPTDLDRLDAPAKLRAIFAALAKLKARPTHKAARAIVRQVGGELAALLEPERRPDWAWFAIVFDSEACRLAEALLRGGLVMGEKDWIIRGLQTLEWMLAGPAARICSGALADACAAAVAATGDAAWLNRKATPARPAFPREN